MHRIAGLIERGARRPVRARDRVLRATSSDGRMWVKDRRVVIDRGLFLGNTMTYFACGDAEGRLWVRASSRRPDGWATEIGHDRSWHDTADLGLVSIGGFCWVGASLYVTARGAATPRVARFDQDLGGWPPREVWQSWEGLDDYAELEDVWIVRDDDNRFHGFCSVGPSSANVSIVRWISSDAIHWVQAGVAVETPHTGRYRLANNPCVVALPSGGWRMYFRSGTRPALGNTIRSAVSEDLAVWRHESGDRVVPGDRWGSHGVAFPFVRAVWDGWEMYYGGFWGACYASRAVAAHWHSVSPETGRAG